MLAACVHHGWSLTTYQQPDHPAQRAGVASIAEATGIPEKEDPVCRGRLWHRRVCHPGGGRCTRLCGASWPGSAHRRGHARPPNPHRGRGRARHGHHAAFSWNALKGRSRGPGLCGPAGPVAPSRQKPSTAVTERWDRPSSRCWSVIWDLTMSQAAPNQPLVPLCSTTLAMSSAKSERYCPAARTRRKDNSSGCGEDQSAWPARTGRQPLRPHRACQRCCPLPNRWAGRSRRAGPQRSPRGHGG